MNLKKFFIKIKILLFFIRNPKYFKGLIPIIIDFIFRRRLRDKERNISIEICKNKAISTSDAIDKILKTKIKNKFKIIYKKEILKSKVLIKNSGVKLGGSGELDLLYWIVKIKKIKNVLETGVASGWSSLAILLAQKDIPDSSLISIDMPYSWINNSSNYVGLAVPKWLRGKWLLIRETDREGLQNVFKKNINFGLVHYDSDKSVFGKRWALNFLYSKLKSKSIMIIDDIGDNLTFHEFVREKKLEHFIVMSEKKFIGIVLI